MKETWIKFLKLIGYTPVKIEETRSIEEIIKSRKDNKWRNSGWRDSER